MAEKKITEVDIITSVDENADYILVARGSQQDIKRLLISGLPTVFDLHDDVADELTSPANADRMLVSDEGLPGAPQKWARLSTLQSFFTNAFDLHDDVATALTAAANNDRLLISDEDQSGDPQKYITVENLLKSVMSFQKLTTEIVIRDSAAVTLNHSLGRVPEGIQARLINKTSEHGYSVGDEVYLAHHDYTSVSAQGDYIFAMYDATSTQIKVKSNYRAAQVIRVPDKANEDAGYYGSITFSKLAVGRDHMGMIGMAFKA